MRPVEAKVLSGFAMALLLLGVSVVLSFRRAGPQMAPGDVVLLLVSAALALGGLSWELVAVRRELKRTERAQQLSEPAQTRLRAVWDKALVAMRLTDGAGRVVLVNNAYCELVGRTQFELEGAPFSHAYSEASRAETVKAYEAAFQSRQLAPNRSSSVTYWNGQSRELEVSDVFLELPGQPTLLLSSFSDITSRRRGERRATLFAQAAQDLSGAASRRAAAEIIVAAAQNLIGWHACFLHLYDASRKLVERTLSQDTINGVIADAAFGPDDLLPSLNFLKVLDAGSQLILRSDETGPSELLAFGDKRRSRSLMFVPVRDSGRAIGVFSIQSYTPQAYNETDLESLQTLADHCAGALQRIRVEEKLLQREQRFRLLIENASDVITVIGADAVIRYQSPSVQRLLGYVPEEMLGRNALEYVHPEDHPPVVAAIRQVASEVNAVAKVEFRFRHHDGRWRMLQCIGRSCVEEADDQFIIVNSRDITESKVLEEQLRQAQKMEAIGRLAGGVAHDFNNMLAVIQMQACMLRADGALSPSQSDMAGEIEKAASRAADLTRQLLLFSRRQAMRPRDVELNELVRNITKMIQRILGEHIRIQIGFAPGDLYVHADPGMIDQVLVNLSVNSRDAMPKGGQLAIETAVVEFDEASAARKPFARSGAFACLSVTDTGCGIPPEILPRVFEPFFTTKDIGKGTGLGLATVFGVVQQHGGWIEVASEVGRGAAFHIYLPRITPAVNQPAVPQAAGQPRGGTETILLAEDEPALRELVRSVLTRLGYRVLEAPTGVRALEVWQENRDDIRLLLTDMVMPDGMTGRELAERLLAAKPDLKVIYTSGYSPENMGKQSPLREGVNFLAKPFAAPKLAEAIRAQLDSQSATIHR